MDKQEAPEKTLTQYTDALARSLALAIRKIPPKDHLVAWASASASMLWLVGQRGPVTIIPVLRLCGSPPKPGTVIPNAIIRRPRKPGSGRKPVMRPCTHCSQMLSARSMRKHVPGCRKA
jgi:hypothetical protein